MDSLAGVAPRRKDIDGAQWLAHLGQKSRVECKSKSQPDWIYTKIKFSNESLV